MTATDLETPPDAGVFWAVPDHTGEDYYTVIAYLHRHLKPRTYLEIGALTGDTLALAECRSVAIDPHLAINQDVIGGKEACLLFQMTSDAFFAAYDPKLLLGERIDVALIDGMHLFEFALRDFINIERHMKSNSVVIVDEAVPVDAHVCRRILEDQTLATRSHHPEWWAGDVWKLVVALRRWRPLLRIQAFDAPPNGVVTITNLDPTSTVLGDRYFEIIADYRKITLQQYGVDKYLQELGVQSTAALATAEGIAELFWL